MFIQDFFLLKWKNYQFSGQVQKFLLFKRAITAWSAFQINVVDHKAKNSISFASIWDTFLLLCELL